MIKMKKSVQLIIYNHELSSQLDGYLSVLDVKSKPTTKATKFNSIAQFQFQSSSDYTFALDDIDKMIPQINGHHRVVYGTFSGELRLFTFRTSTIPILTGIAIEENIPTQGKKQVLFNRILDTQRNIYFS